MQISRLDGLKNWLRIDRNFYKLFAVVAGFIAFWKGFRLPYDWAATQAQFDYRFGLVRLGLFGSICSWLHLHIIDYRVFSLVSFALLFLLLILIFRAALSSSLAEPCDGLFIVLIAASYALTYTVNLVGYLDISLMLVLFLALRVRGRIPGLAAITVGAVVGCLLHELYLVSFLPLLMMNQVRRAEDEGLSWRNLLPIFISGVFPAVLVIKLCGHVALTPAQMLAFANDWHQHANFHVRDDFFGVLKRPLSQILREAFMYFRAGEWWIEEIFLGAAFFPAVFFLLHVAHRFLGERRKWSRRYVTFAVLSPMFMNLIAVDFTRWMSFVGVNAIIAAVVSASRPESAAPNPISQRPFGSLARNVAMLLIAVNLATNTGMFMRGTDATFLGHWRRFRENRLRHRPMFSYRDPNDYKFLGPSE